MSAVEAVEEAVENLTSLIAETDGVVETGVLPEIIGDPPQIVRLFQNLIGNAMKYHDPRHPPEVRIEADEADGVVTFAVRDNGIGIDAQHFERIFVIFQRLHGRHEFKGTGIGLAVCKRIVERHGGRIWVESEPAKGTTFFFTLPAAD